VRLRSSLSILVALTFIALCVVACGDNLKPIREDGGQSDAPLSAAKALTSFSFEAADNTVLPNDVTATITGTTVAATVPFGTNLTALVATFTTTGTSVTVGGTPQVSGTTPNSFTDAVAYTVTAEDGSTQIFTVTVTPAPSDAKEITAFSFEAADNNALTADVAATITGTTITATVPFGTDVSQLVATFSTTGTKVEVGAIVQVSGTTANNFANPVSYVVTAADNTTNTYTVTVIIAPNTAKEITAFSFETANNAGLSADVVAVISGTSISATVPFGTNVSALVATFSTSGANVTVNAVTQVSGTTANDFTNPVSYLVTAADNSTQTYTVTVTIAANSAKAITAFSFETINNAGLQANVIGVISGTSITATVPFGTDITGLVATFSTTGNSVTVGGTPQVSGTTPNDFTSQVSYVVTAADNTMQTYIVSLNVATNTAKDITSFQFLSAGNQALAVNVTATISGTAITAIVPFGTDITNLIATFSTTGDSVAVSGIVQVSGTTANDFTSAVDYTVTASDNSTKTYTVTVINSLSGDKNILAFSILGIDGIINGTNISLVVPNGTDLTALIPTISISGASVSPGSLVPNNFTAPATYTVTAADNTTKQYTVTVLLASQIAKDITRFTINGLDAIIADTSATSGTITINMPNGTDLTALSPVVTITGVSVSPASGQTVNFTNTVNYVVTAADGSMKTYTVNVGIVNGNGTKLISSFTILGVDGQITNGAQSSTITLTLPAGTDLTAQTPTIVINASSINPPSRVPQDFTMPVIYTVTAADGSTRVYTVTVTLAP
jgi:hypothetical protein